MSDEPDAYSQIVADLVGRHQPRTALDTAMVEICARTMIELKSADAGDVPRLANSLMLMVATLPTPPGDDDDPWDIKKLSDAQLAALDDINVTARSLDRQPWRPPEPEPERPMGECERAAVKLGVYLDQHRDQWRGRALNENERIDIMNFLTDIGCPANVILRNVFRPLVQSEIDSAVTAAILRTEDRLLRASEAKDAPRSPAAPEREASSGTNVFDLPLPRVRDYGDNET